MAGPPPPQPGAVPPGQPGVPVDPRASISAAQDEVLQQILGAELPGDGYAFPDDPEKRQAQLVKTTPAFVRDNLLRAIEVQSYYAQLPLSEEKPADIGKLILAMAQSFLLLDPTLDAEGVPIEGEGSKPHAEARAQHEFPPRAPENPAEEASKERHKGQSTILSKTHGQEPRPEPRVSGA